MSRLNITGKLFFGHPVNSYNTPFEEWLVMKINRYFPNCVIENPNQLKHQESYKKWKKEKGNGMRYFFEEVLPSCDAGGIFLPFKDGAWGAGVYGEAEEIIKKNPIWTIDHYGHIEHVPSLERIIPLSVEETRKRVYLPSGEISVYH